MAMPADQSKFTISVDNEETLPFGLLIRVGRGRYEKKILVKALTRSPQRVTEVMYDILEMQDLYLELVTTQSVTVKVLWDIVAQYELDEEGTRELTLSQQNRRFELFSDGPNKPYPWRCGNYLFEVNVGQHKYYGGYRIVPKYMGDSQLDNIHQLLNQYIKGLVTDIHTFHRSVAEMYHQRHLFYWRYYVWIKQNIGRLLSGLRLIERYARMDLIKHYRLESRPGRQNIRSFRWQLSKGNRFGSARFYNRHMMEEWDQKDNRMAKYQVLQILRKMNRCINEIRTLYNRCYKESKDNEQHRNTLQQKIDLFDQNWRTTKRFIRRYETQIKELNSHLNELNHQISQFQAMQNHMLKYHHQIQTALNSPFWRTVRPWPDKKVSLTQGKGYHILQQLWEESESIVDTKTHDKSVVVPAHHPTSRLYEYFVYFGVVHCLQEMGFKIQYNPKSGDLLSVIGHNGLEEGFTITLKSNYQRIDVVYDQYIEINSQEARQKQTYFYSGGFHRRPDVRVDCYDLQENDEWRYRSSFILEVKYRALNYIYNEDLPADTKAMEQMYDYGSIGYIYPDARFNHRPIEKVFCVYPGDPDHEIIFPMDHGYMLQFYPRESSNDPQDIVGKEELIKELEEWIRE